MSPAVDPLRVALERRFRTEVTPIEAGPYELQVLHPANADDLIREEDYVRDERLPYWADLWPSSHALAAEVATMRGRGKRFLELGCGAGVVTTMAALRGFAVVATDYYDDALDFAAANAWYNASVRIATRNVDWRDFPDDIGQFDVVVASDVLYEAEYVPLIASAIARTLSPRGFAVIADPGRVAAVLLPDACKANGLRVQTARRVPFESGEIRQTIDLLEVRRVPA